MLKLQLTVVKRFETAKSLILSVVRAVSDALPIQFTCNFVQQAAE